MSPIQSARPLRAAALVLAALGAGCAAVPDATPPRAPAPAWHAPLPHQGDTVALKAWWSRFDDPLLPALIDEAQRSSPTLAQAAARVVQARANLRAAASALWPATSLHADAARQRTELPPPPITATSGSANVQAAWEIDLFGGVRQGVAAAEAHAEASALAWHDARISLAADTAQTYVDLRACEALAAVYDQDARSQARSVELTHLKTNVGFEAPALASLVDASAAEAANRYVAQRAECDILVKALVLLTGVPEPQLRERLAGRGGRLPQPAVFEVQAVPAQMLAQRPDMAAAERELRAAAAEVGVADASRYPRLLLNGSVGVAGLRTSDGNVHGNTWSIGPSIDLPLFDAGRRRAALEAARARFDEARAGYELRARQAVREVEEALVRLDSADRRIADAERAVQGYRAHFEAAERRWQVGTGSVIEMEDAHRLALAAQAGLVNVQRERVAAWVSLYRAVGGGWEPQAILTKGMP